MEFIQNIIMTIILAVCAVGSIALVVCLIQSIVHWRKNEKREEERAARDKEYHEKRMNEHW